MLPPLDQVDAGLRLTTETLAAEMASSSADTPTWSAQEWRLAAAAAAAHGVAPRLALTCRWQNSDWQSFLSSQREHVAIRHQHLTILLNCIDAQARARQLAMVALKGCALHALGVYVAGDRPMADIDLLVAAPDAERAASLLSEIGYAEVYAQWKHRVFKPVKDCVSGSLTLGEHRSTTINIELHTRIAERLPVSTVDITAQIAPSQPQAGLNPYPSVGALMSHLLLHAAGNICNCNIRLIQLNDIAQLARRMTNEDWHTALNHGRTATWWSLPPLQLTARYYPDAIPSSVLTEVEPHCPALLRSLTRRRTLSRVSASRLWLQVFPGIEWSRSPGEAAQYVKRRVRPPEESKRERADMIRTQAWLQGQDWVSAPKRRRLLTWLTRRVPRTDTMHVVRAAFESASFDGEANFLRRDGTISQRDSR